mmetsp:Transcript_7533/g.7603  ORF Transcript_7533/g.7603 Transcript_7533/m.7603 type:complete len:201 (+) Transcript_7533:319-921(+)
MGDVGAGDNSVSIDNVSCDDESYHSANLSELCIITILRKGFLSVNIAASICLRIPDVSINPRYERLWEGILKFLKEQGGLLLERYDNKELAKYFGEEVVLSLLKIQESRLNAEKKLAGYRCGSVVEKKNSYCNVDLELRFLNHGCYPLCALLQGVAWPEGVQEYYCYAHPFFSTSQQIISQSHPPSCTDFSYNNINMNIF